MFKRKKDGGFTLIELMIVIAVIGILAVVMVPKMGGIKTSAKNVGVETNLKSVQVFVTANLDKWISTDKTEAQVVGEIFKQFNAEDNEFKNPFSGEKVISSDIVDIDDTVTGIDTSINVNDALQIISSVTSLDDNNDDSNGAVVLNLKGFDSDGIIEMAGYDKSGNIVDSVVKVKP